jgi:hypothetical protein
MKEKISTKTIILYSSNTTNLSICPDDKTIPNTVKIKDESIRTSVFDIRGPLISDKPLEFKLQEGHHLIMPELNSPKHIITFNVADGDLTLSSVAPKTSFHLQYLEKSYTFTNQQKGPVNFGNIHKFIEICETVGSFFANGIPLIGSVDLPLEKICFLKDFQKLDHGLVSSFMKQNGKVSAAVVDSFIDYNFLELTVTKSLAGTNLDKEGSYKGINEVFAHHICSNLKLEDVKLELAGANVDNLESDGA